MELCPIIGRFVTRFLHLKDGKLYLGTIAIEAMRTVEIKLPLATYDKLTFHDENGRTAVVGAESSLDFYAGTQRLSYEGLLQLGKYRNGEDASWYDFTGMDAIIQEMHEVYDLPLIPTLNAAQQAARIIAAYLTNLGWSCSSADADAGDAIDEDDEGPEVSPPSSAAEGDLLELNLPRNVILDGSRVTLVYETMGDASDEYEYLADEIRKKATAAPAEEA